MNRAEHLAWAKERALEYVDAGDNQQAFASMASDLWKHPELAAHPAIEVGMLMLLGGPMSAEQMRSYIIDAFY